MTLTAKLMIFLCVNGRHCSLASWVIYSRDDLLRKHFSYFHSSCCKRWEQTFIHNPLVPDTFEKNPHVSHGYTAISRIRAHTRCAYFLALLIPLHEMAFGCPSSTCPPSMIFNDFASSPPFFVFSSISWDSFFLTDFFFAYALPASRDFTSSN